MKQELECELFVSRRDCIDYTVLAEVRSLFNFALLCDTFASFAVLLFSAFKFTDKRTLNRKERKGVAKKHSELRDDAYGLDRREIPK